MKITKRNWQLGWVNW